jgi:hypothetical protein
MEEHEYDMQEVASWIKASFKLRGYPVTEREINILARKLLDIPGMICHVAVEATTMAYINGKEWPR